jgi:hypothetical protein
MSALLLLGLLSPDADAAPTISATDPHRLVGSLSLLGYRMSLARVYAGGGSLCSIEAEGDMAAREAEGLPEPGSNPDSRSCVVGGSAAQLQLGTQLFDPRRVLSPILVADIARDVGREATHRTLTLGAGGRVNLRPRGALSPFASGTLDLGAGGGGGSGLGVFPGVSGQLGLELGSQSGHHLDLALTGRASRDLDEPLSLLRLALEVGYQL